LGYTPLFEDLTMSRSITVEYPDTLPDALHMSHHEFEREARLAMAVKLFETGKLSSGQAARLAGLSRLDFLHELSRYGVSSIQVEAAELENDVAQAMRAHDRHQQQPGH
jgi:predicted HTH domain antitoxin